MSENKPKDVRQQEILQAAIACFARKGYSNTSVNDITTEAGLTKGGLYHHFASKWDIFCALIQEYAHSTESLWAKLLTQEENSSDIEQIGLLFLEHLIKNKSLILLKAEIESEAFRNPEIREQYRQIFIKLRQILSRFLSKIKEERGLTAMDPDQAALLSEMTIIGLARRYLLLGGDFDYKQTWGTYCRMILQGLK